jgi:hypothetical protein
MEIFMGKHASIWFLTGLLILGNSPSIRCQQTGPQSGTAAEEEAARVKPQTTEDQKQTAGLERKTEASKGTSQTTGSAEQVPKWLQLLRTGTEILAYLLAFFFFLYKSYEGYLTTNLSLSLQCKRCAVPTGGEKSDQDYLAVIATIKKGENGLLKLLQAELQITAPSFKAPCREILDVRRVDYDRSKVLKGDKDAIHWTQAKEGWPFLQFPPGDGSQFARWFKVPTGEPCQVDVVVMGKNRWPKIKTSQWRASDISLPKYDQSEGKNPTEKG